MGFVALPRLHRMQAVLWCGVCCFVAGPARAQAIDLRGYLLASEMFNPGFVSGTPGGANSAAYGQLSVATGDNSLAVGYGNSALGPNSLAMGQFSLAGAPNSLALGVQSSATGANAWAVGNQAQALGDNSTALGLLSTRARHQQHRGRRSQQVDRRQQHAYGAAGACDWRQRQRRWANLSQAIGDNSTALGILSVAGAPNTTAVGNQAQATGNNSTAFGVLAVAPGDDGAAFGNQANAAGRIAAAFVALSQATGESSTAIGGVARALGLIQHRDRRQHACQRPEQLFGRQQRAGERRFAVALGDTAQATQKRRHRGRPERGGDRRQRHRHRHGCGRDRLGCSRRRCGRIERWRGLWRWRPRDRHQRDRA